MAYSKPWQSYEEQLDLLISRGLAVTDRPKALEYLQRIGYHCLSSGYWVINAATQCGEQGEG